ncbi:MAG: HAD-IB family hydrolase [Acidimicrobiales bacterium]
MVISSDLPELLGSIDATTRGKRSAAFLDVDRAVVTGVVRDPAPTSTSRRGIGPLRLPEKPLSLAQVIRVRKGATEDDMASAGAKAFARKFADAVYPEVRELVAAHHRKGHQVVLTSSATRFVIQPLADALGADAVVCTEVKVSGGKLTGTLVGPVCAGADKAAAVERWAGANGVDLGRSFAYAGEDDALPLLELVGTPRPTNPSGKVAASAEQRGWPVARFESRGRPSPETLVRSVAAYGALLPSMLGGVAMGLLNRDRHEIAQHGVATYVQRLFAITGVRLDVQGEEHVWSQRPAVFIYNHRNNFDPYVAIKLVGRDWGSVAKKEIAGPLIGAMQWLTPNIAFLDRSDQEKAIEGLQPVTELLRSGVSVLVAPEGTRSVSGQLGRFKKGPFRMAMEAGVPVVPIVIRNADQVASREAMIIRPGTIDVAVLPPVDVSGWTSDGVDARIEEVRQMYASTLAEWPSKSSA